MNQRTLNRKVNKDLGYKTFTDFGFRLHITDNEYAKVE
jgi:hypothetical protein